MDGIHDLGGMQGFGAVEREADEPTFHEPWEATAFRLNAVAIGLLRAYNTDEYRHAVERMEPLHYLSARYYERMLTGVATLLVEKGVLTLADLEARAGGAFPLARPVAGPGAAPGGGDGARFAVGDTVRVRNDHPAGHTRMPRYVRGKTGTVVFVAPRFSYPDAAAHGGPARSEHTCHVRFGARELWGDAAEEDTCVVVDLWDSYLEALA
ncbi:MAG: nitrile hydratase subunit beta [Myxococcota bacterium]